MMLTLRMGRNNGSSRDEKALIDGRVPGLTSYDALRC